MKRYGVIALIMVVIAAAILFVVDVKKKDTVSGELKPGEKIEANKTDGKTGNADQAAENANSTKDETGVPTDKNKEEVTLAEKQDEVINDIKRMFKPEWDKLNQAADKRLSELMVQAQKEFKTKKDNKQDISRLEGKYLNIYNDYEQDTKTQVDRVISNMQKEVIEKNLQTNIGEEYFEIYQLQKEKRAEKVASELKKLS